MSFCPKCGNQLTEDTKFCPKCGKSLEDAPAEPAQPVYSAPPYQTAGQQFNYAPPVQPVYPPSQPYYPPQKNIVEQLSGKVRAEAIIWTVIACIQYIFGLILITQNSGMYDSDETSAFVVGIVVILAAILNTLFSVANFEYSRKVLQNPVGIVNRFMPVGTVISTLIYNILFGGIIGIAGSIYAFTIRSFVLTNEAQFIQIEQQILSQRQYVQQ